ncbi:MAG: hypothetical protein FGM40_08445 [Rhodocyclaceae bacterium]|nr:hypothetical protein [Rhodocyclaceae bacterium]
MTITLQAGGRLLARAVGVLLLPALLAVPLPAAADWLRLGATEEGDVHYVDVDTLRVSGPRRVQIMVRIELARPTWGMETRSIRVLVEHDCLLRRQRSLQATYFTGPNLGGNADAGRGQGVWTDVQAGTLGSELQGLVCRYR